MEVDLRATPVRAHVTRSASAVLAAVLLAGGVGSAATPVPDPVLTANELLGEAVADECFAGIGVDYPPISPDGTCPEGMPKTNESYVWSVAVAGDRVFFGTLANSACIVSRSNQEAAPGAPLAIERSDDYVCEYGESQWAREIPQIPDGLGDWRPPSIYEYDLSTGELRERAAGDPLLTRSLGLRGAGAVDGIAFLAGPYLQKPSVNLFAFAAADGEYLGSCEMVGMTHVRDLATVEGVLYVAAGSSEQGLVLRWNGDLASFDGDFCADFTVVGELPARPASLTAYRGGDGESRVAATTMALRDGRDVGVWLSPPLGPDGLGSDDAGGWTRAWSTFSYEPDLIVALYGYMGGALHFFDGWLYWGTMHLANSPASRIHERCEFDFCFGPPADAEAERALRVGVARTATLWRGRNLESRTGREIQLLYGETELPAVTAPGTFEPVATGWEPLYGASGFDNTANQYVWRMAVHDGRLYVGTYDASVFRGLPGIGADLWRFDSADGPAVNEAFEGLGDTNNYGIRAMVPLEDDSALILGMANPFNLVPGGGWELRRLSAPP